MTDDLNISIEEQRAILADRLALWKRTHYDRVMEAQALKHAGLDELAKESAKGIAQALKMIDFYRAKAALLQPGERDAARQEQNGQADHTLSTA